MQPPAQMQELEIAFGGMVQPRVVLELALAPEALGDVDTGPEPSRVEDEQVVGADHRLIAVPQGIAAEEDGKGPARIQLAGAGDHRFQGLACPPVGVEGV